jgi:uncharacterized repeat protein (TIGR01451 family)
VTLSTTLTANDANSGAIITVAPLVSNTVLIHAPQYALDVRKFVSTAAPGPGDPVTYRIVVTNTGIATVTGLTVSDTVSPVITNLSPDEPVGFPAPAVVSVAPGGTRFVWDAGALPLSPGMSWTFTVAGRGGEICSPVVFVNQAFLRGDYSGGGATTLVVSAPPISLSPPTLAISVNLVQSPGGPVAMGTPVQYRIFITHSGTATVTSLLVSDTLSPVLTGVTTLQPVALGPPLLAQVAGGTLYLWSATGIVMGPGTSWTLTISGTAGPVPSPVTAVNRVTATAGTACSSVSVAAGPVSLGVQPPAMAALSAALAITPATQHLGGTFTVVLTVTNVGAAGALAVSPVLGPVSGGSFVHLVSGPAPSGPVGLGVGASTTFTWVYAADLGGVVVFSATASGTDAALGAAVSAAANAATTIADPVDPGVVKVIVGPRGVVRPFQGEPLIVLVHCKDPGPITLRIVTMNGVLVIRMDRPTPGTGTERFVWDGRDASGSYVAPGGYVLLVEAPGIRHQSKFAVVR